MEGWIKLHREVLDTDLWHDVTTFRLFLYLICQATHQDGTKIKGIELKRGQYIRSYRKLADDLSFKEGRGYKKYSLSTIKSCVNKLIKAERVNVRETEVGTLFTIINYAKYQDLEGEEKRSTNTSNDKVRTNTELTPNEVRTNAEQEQECKNARMQEYISTTTVADQKFSEIIQTFESSLCRLSALQIDSLGKWLEDFGNNKDIILEAIKIADDRNKRTFGFVEYLLKEWHNNKLTSIEQIQTYERNKFPKQNQNFKSRNPVRTEKLPSWFIKQKEQQKSLQDNDASFQLQKLELEERLKKYRERA